MAHRNLTRFDTTRKAITHCSMVDQQKPGEVEPPAPSIYSDEVLNKHRIWKKNSPNLYDFLITQYLPWPSLTIQWLPDVDSNGDMTTQRLLAGTRTAGNGDESLRIIALKRQPIEPDTEFYDQVRGEFGRYQSTSTKLEIIHQIHHGVGEINRARFMPQNCDVLATFASNGRAYLFDRSKHPLQRAKMFAAEAVFDFHTTEGFGLAWSGIQKGYLLTASESIAFWDVVKHKFNQDKSLKPAKVLKTHENLVNEVDWHPHVENIFASVSDDCQLQIHDLSSDANLKRTTYSSPLNCVKFSPANEFLVATASTDSTIQLWDTRSLEKPIMVLQGHNDSVTSLEWSPHHPTVLASGSSDHMVMVWDIAHDPESLIFCHGGHMSEVNDISWNPAKHWELASVGMDNQLHIYQIASTIVKEQS